MAPQGESCRVTKEAKTWLPSRNALCVIKAVLNQQPQCWTELTVHLICVHLNRKKHQKKSVCTYPLSVFSFPSLCLKVFLKSSSCTMPAIFMKVNSVSLWCILLCSEAALWAHISSCSHDMKIQLTLQPDLSLSEGQQCSALKSGIYVTLNRAICQVFHWHKLKWN